ALLALPTLFGREIVLERAGRYAQNPRSTRALANLAQVYRLLRIYGLADSVLLDLGEVRGFDYYSGLYFEAYVSGFGAALAGGGRYDDMLGRFGYDCPAVGFAFDIARALAIMENQQVSVELPGPDFFIIDFTAEKTAALSLARRLRDLGASVARDIISRGLEEFVDYARAQRVRHVLVVARPARHQPRRQPLHLQERAPDHALPPRPRPRVGGQARPAAHRHHGQGRRPRLRRQDRARRHPDGRPARRAPLPREARVQPGPEEPSAARLLRRRDVRGRGDPQPVPAIRRLARPLHHGHRAAAQHVDRERLLGAVRGRAGHHARHRPRHLSVHHVVLDHGRRRRHRHRRAADEDPRRARRGQGVLDARGRRALPHGNDGQARR